MSNKQILKYSVVLLSLLGLVGCAADSTEDPLLGEDFAAYHHPGDDGETDTLLAQVTKVKADPYSFEVRIQVDKATYLAAMQEIPEDGGIDGAELRTAMDLEFVITDALGRVRHFDPICPPIVDPNLQPLILSNMVILTANISWDRLADDGVTLMKGWSAVDAQVSLLAEHDHRFHDQLETTILSSAEDEFTLKLPKIHSNNGNHYGQINHADN